MSPHRLALALAAAFTLGVTLVVSFPTTVAASVGAGQQHFFAQAAAWLAGELTLPLASGFAELVPVDDPTRGAVAYPPAPSLLALPFVAAGVPIELAARLLALGLFVMICTTSLRLLAARGAGGPLLAAVGVTIAAGSGLWFLAAVPSSWYLAQLAGLAFGLGALLVGPRWPLLGGLLLGLATASRLPVGLGVAILLSADLLRSATPRRSLLLALLGGLPVALAWGALNLARFGDPLDNGYARIPGVIAEPWFADGIASLAYMPRSLEALLLRLPGSDGSMLVPDLGGMAVWIVAPALLVLPLALRRTRPSRTTTIAIVATVAALLPGLLHGSWGFTQLGYRFAYDALPGFLLLALAAAPQLERRRALVIATLVVGLFVNLWAYLQLGGGHWTIRGL